MLSRYAEFCYAECRYDECHGAHLAVIIKVILQIGILSF